MVRQLDNYMVIQKASQLIVWFLSCLFLVFIIFVGHFLETWTLIFKVQAAFYEYY